MDNDEYNNLDVNLKIKFFCHNGGPEHDTGSGDDSGLESHSGGDEGDGTCKV